MWRYYWFNQQRFYQTEIQRASIHKDSDRMSTVFSTLTDRIL